MSLQGLSLIHQKDSFNNQDQSIIDIYKGPLYTINILDWNLSPTVSGAAMIPAVIDPISFY